MHLIVLNMPYTVGMFFTLYDIDLAQAEANAQPLNVFLAKGHFDS